MSNSIDRGKLLSDLGSIYMGMYPLSKKREFMESVEELVKNQPAIDSVVHCKDCIYYETHLMNSCMNTFWNHDAMFPTKPDDYCSKGVRKMDEDTEREDNK